MKIGALKYLASLLLFSWFLKAYYDTAIIELEQSVIKVEISVELLCESTHVCKLENLCFSTFCELTLAQYISIFHVAILMRGLKNMQEIQFALDEFQ